MPPCENYQHMKKIQYILLWFTINMEKNITINMVKNMRQKCWLRGFQVRKASRVKKILEFKIYISWKSNSIIFTKYAIINTE